MRTKEQKFATIDVKNQRKKKWRSITTKNSEQISAKKKRNDQVTHKNVIETQAAIAKSENNKILRSG